MTVQFAKGVVLAILQLIPRLRTPQWLKLGEREDAESPTEFSAPDLNA